MYEVIAAPPLSVGAVKLTIKLLPLTAAVTFEGALGTPAGITGEVADDSTEFPIVVVAIALKVYADPLSNPVTMQLVCPGFGLQEPATFPFESYAVIV
jgi:hypothetical protein